MDPKVLEQIVAVLSAHDVTKFELQEDGVILKLSRSGGEAPVVFSSGAPLPYRVETEHFSAPQQQNQSGAPKPTSDVSPEDARLVPVISPMVGTFYRRPSPDDEMFVSVGSKVKKGQTLCIIEAMKLMNEIEAPCDGEIKKILLEDASVVEFGEHLFMIDPA